MPARALEGDSSARGEGARRPHQDEDSTELHRQVTQAVDDRTSPQDCLGHDRAGRRLRDLLDEHAHRAPHATT